MAEPTHPSEGSECMVDAGFYEDFPSLGDDETRELLHLAVSARLFEIETILEDEERTDEEAVEDILDAVRDTLLLKAVGKLCLMPDGAIRPTTPVGPAPSDAALAKIYDRLDVLEADILETVDELVGED